MAQCAAALSASVSSLVPLQRVSPKSARPCARRTVPGLVRASDLKEHGPSGDEWRPPSDWDNAWSAYKASSSSPTATPKSNLGAGRNGGSGTGGGARRMGPLSHMEQYVSRSPNRSDYPLAEEIDPLRRTERVALAAWTDLKFTYAGFAVVAVMFVYMAVIVGPPPS